MSGRGSRVVFVGNIPYDMSEEQLMDVFKEVGKVVGFRLVFDRNTGKPKGYGFCEFEDPETAASAVRNLDQVEIRGRPLRISGAEEDPLFEGKSTNMGQVDDDTAAARERMKAAGIRRPGPQGGGGNMGFGMGGGNMGGGNMGYGMGGMGPGMGGPGMMGGPGGPQGGMMGGPPPFGPKQDAGWGRGPAPGGFQPNAGPPQLPPNLPQGTPLPPGVGSTDAISQTLASLPPAQLLDIMSQTKALASTHPDQARTLLNSHPQLAYALFQAMLMMNVVDPAILQRILASSGALSGAGGFDVPGQAGGYQATPPQGRPPAPAPQYGGAPPPSSGYPGGQYGVPPPSGPGGLGAYGSPHVQQQQQQQAPPNPYGQPPPQQSTPIGQSAAPAGAPNLPSDQQELLMQVLQLTDEQISALPPDQRAGIMQLRAQMGR